MTSIANDLRFAWRQLSRRPGFAAAATLTIALGIAAVGGMFSLVDAVLLKPLDVPAADRVVQLHRPGSDEADVSLVDAVALRRELELFDALAVVSPQWALDLEREGAVPLHLKGGLTESQYFAAVAVRPLLGRVLEPRDDAAGAPSVAVLGERFWRSEYGADPAIVGREIRLSGVATTIVGVVPDAADVWDLGIQAWVPTPSFAAWAATSPGSNNFELVARLREGASLEAASAELATVSAQRAASDPMARGKTLTATPLLRMLTDGVRRSLWLVFGAAALVLVLGAVNVASLLLTRMSGRRREIAVRHALGAQRRRIARQLLVEGLVLAAIGAVVGLTLLSLALDFVSAFASETLPRVALATVDLRVVGIAALAAIASAAGFSLAPALHARARALADGLRGARALGGRSEARTLGVLVVAETALAAVLVIVAALLLRSFVTLAQQPLGFSPGGVALGEVVLPESRYAEFEAQSRAVVDMVARLDEAPGVEASAFVVGTPLSGSCCIGHSLLVEGVEFGSDSRQGARYRPFHGDLFGALGVDVVAGRAPTAADFSGGERVAWVNERFAARYLSGGDPVGRRIAWTPSETDRGGDTVGWMRVAGVIRDYRAVSMRDGDEVAVYSPYVQREDGWIRFGHLVARVAGEPAQFRTAFEQAIAAVDPAVPLAGFETLPERVRGALSRDRFALQLVAGFGAIALLLGLQGVFGVVAFTVERRRAEIGLRLALGSRPGAAVGLIVGEISKQLVAGLLFGVAGALLCGRLLEGMLHEIQPRDPLAFAAALAALGAAGMLAVWLPARRAARVAPMTVLREE